MLQLAQLHSRTEVSRAHLDLILSHCLQRVISVPADTLVDGKQEQVPASAAVAQCNQLCRHDAAKQENTTQCNLECLCNKVRIMCDCANRTCASLVALVQRRQDVRQHRGVLATGCAHGDALAAHQQLLADNGLVHLLLEGREEALPAELREGIGSLSLRHGLLAAEEHCRVSITDAPGTPWQLGAALLCWCRRRYIALPACA